MATVPIDTTPNNVTLRTRLLGWMATMSEIDSMLHHAEDLDDFDASYLDYEMGEARKAIGKVADLVVNMATPKRKRGR